MSLTTTPNANDYIERFGEMLENSPFVFPNSIGGNDQVEDLVKQVILYELPINEQPLTGQGPPMIFIANSRNPIINRRQTGRDSRDVQGPELLTLEVYIVIVVQGLDYADSQTQLYNIIQAITTTLLKNLRMVDQNGDNPLCRKLSFIDLPWILESDDKRVIARNFLVRPEVYVTLR